jgi:hypothetical protein
MSTKDGIVEWAKAHPWMTFFIATGIVSASSDTLISIFAPKAKAAFSPKIETKAETTKKADPPLPKPIKANDKSAERLPFVAARIRRVFPSASGLNRPIKPHEEQLILSMAWLESGLANDSEDADGPKGSWWKDAMVGSGNLGALQCFRRDIEAQKAGKPTPPHYSCKPFGDKRQLADGSWQPYETMFRFFRSSNQDANGAPTDAETSTLMSAADGAAWEYVREIWRQRPKGGKAISDGKSIREIAKALREENYHGVTPDHYADAIWSHAAHVAEILKQPLALHMDQPATVAGFAYTICGEYDKPRKRARLMPFTDKIIWYEVDNARQ